MEHHIAMEVHFKIVADCITGRGNLAYETLNKILPDSKLNPSERSGCEPYALTNMYLGPENPRAGQTMFAWVTGTAGWIYRAVTQYMMGFYPGYENVRFNPCLPSYWKECSFKRTYRGSIYQIHIKNEQGKQTGISACFVDGKLIQGNEIPYFKDGGVHEIHYYYVEIYIIEGICQVDCLRFS